MRVTTLLSAAAAVMAVGAVAAPLRAQDTAFAVRPGMTEQDVRSRWGEPIAVRRLNDWTYMFYDNGMERDVGYHDVVLLQNGQVVDAVVRMPGRVYLGQSSSPPTRWPEFTPPAQRQRPEEGGAAVTGVRVNPPPQPGTRP